MTKAKRQRRPKKSIHVLYETDTKLPSGLLRSKRIIKTERDKEILFLKMCDKIQLNDFWSDRAEEQRNNRISKRLIKRQKNKTID